MVRDSDSSDNGQEDDNSASESENEVQQHIPMPIRPCTCQCRSGRVNCLCRILGRSIPCTCTKGRVTADELQNSGQGAQGRSKDEGYSGFCSQQLRNPHRRQDPLQEQHDPLSKQIPFKLQKKNSHEPSDDKKEFTCKCRCQGQIGYFCQCRAYNIKCSCQQLRNSTKGEKKKPESCKPPLEKFWPDDEEDDDDDDKPCSSFVLGLNNGLKPKEK